MICFSCATPDVDLGGVNKLRPEVNKKTNITVDPNANIAEDNEVELNSIINLPFDSEENVYREDVLKVTKANPNYKKLTAVLKFSKDDAEKLLEQLKAEGQPFESKIDPELWFPAELIAKSQTSGDETIKGVGYSGKMFFKAPYNTGSITQIIDTEYFVLILETRQ
jgi:hypothetical protein